MDYPGNNNGNGFSPPQNPSAKKKRKMSNAAARRAAAAAAAAAAEGPRFPFPSTSSSNNSRPDCLLPPAPIGGPNHTLVASNPFDDSPASMSGSGPSRGPPPGYPAGMDFMMMMRGPGPSGMQPQPPPPMNRNYAPMTSNANIPRMPQNFGHTVGPMFNEPMHARIPGPRPRLPRGEPPPYPNTPVSGAINTLSRMHMSMGNVNVANPPAAVNMVNNPSVNLNLAGMPPTRMMPPNMSGNDNKRKAPPFYVGQPPVQPYQPFQYNVAGQIHHRPPMCDLPSHFLGSMPYNQPQPIGPTVPSNSILQSQLTRPVNPPTAPQFSTAGKYPPLTLEQQVPDASPTPCGGCELDVYPADEAVMCGAGCEFWFHRECSGLTVIAHHLLLTTESAEWTCDFCFSTKDVPLVKFV